VAQGVGPEFKPQYCKKKKKKRRRRNENHLYVTIVGVFFHFLIVFETGSYM
jgi:hypothetical protein